MLAFGIPLNLLPQKLDQPYYLYGNKGKPELKWYECYTIRQSAANFIKTNCASREKITGGTLHLFSSTQSSRTFSKSDPGVKLYISAKLTEKGDAEELNQKMWQMDHFLAEYKRDPERFVTQVKGESGTIEVEFTDEYKYGAFPRHLESQVIKKRYQ